MHLAADHGGGGAGGTEPLGGALLAARETIIAPILIGEAGAIRALAGRAYQRFSAASSSSSAATQASPEGPISFFQNGARDFR